MSNHGRSETANKDEYRFLHISDTHEVDFFKSIDMAKWDKIIVTGDITHGGSERAYKETKARLDKHDLEREKFILLPGNHDFGMAGNYFDERCIKRWRNLASGANTDANGNKHCCSHIIDDTIAIITLNSVIMSASPFNFACGEIGAEQLAELDCELAMANDNKYYVIVALHHHPFIHGETTMKLIDASKFLSVVHGRAHMMLFGHQHIGDHWLYRWDIPHILAAPSFYDEAWGWDVKITPSLATAKIKPCFACDM